MKYPFWLPQHFFPPLFIVLDFPLSLRYFFFLKFISELKVFGFKLFP